MKCLAIVRRLVQNERVFIHYTAKRSPDMEAGHPTINESGG